MDTDCKRRYYSRTGSKVQPADKSARGRTMGCTITTNFTETPAEQAKAIGASKQQIRELGMFICHCKAVSFADTVRLIITAGKRGSLEVMAIYKRNGETTDICMIEWARNGELLDVCFT